MNVSEMNWSQVEAYLQHDDRAILPLGSTEQHQHEANEQHQPRVSLEQGAPLDVVH